MQCSRSATLKMLVCVSAESLGVGSIVPKADRDRLRAFAGDEGHSVTEALLVAKDGQHLLLEEAAEFDGAVWLQFECHVTRDHAEVLLQGRCRTMSCPEDSGRCAECVFANWAGEVRNTSSLGLVRQYRTASVG